MQGLNASQLSVLEWVKAGCPEGVFDGYAHRISAAALKSRGLLRVSGRGPTWCAEITEEGVAYLNTEHAASNRSGETNVGRQDRHAKRHTPSSESASSPKPKTPRPLPPTEQLIADLLAADGVLRVPYWRREGERDYRQLVDSAQRWNKVPEGRRVVTDLVKGELEIRLVDAPEGTVIAAGPVSVPVRLSKPHPVARQFREDSGRHQVSRAALPRTVRIIHALAVASERRGYEVKKLQFELPPRRGYARRSMTGGADFEIVIRGHRYGLHVFEEKVPLRGVWEDDQRWQKSDYFHRHAGIEPRIGRYDKDGTSRLTISLDGYGRSGRQSSWGDRRSWTLEEKLPEVLREIEVRAVEDDHAAEERRRSEEERERQWEAAVGRAKLGFVESEREKVLRGQIADWQEARLFERYLAELERAHGDDPDAADWIEWVRGLVIRLNPLSRPARMPEVPEPRPEELKPFLSGWSPYGPRRW